jgi:HIV Tat-specific factor 1
VKPKIKIYTDENGHPKGDGLVTYLDPLAVKNAMQVLDGADFRPPKKEFIKLEIVSFGYCSFSPSPARLPRKAWETNQKARWKGIQETEEIQPKRRVCYFIYRIGTNFVRDLGWDEKEKVHVIIKYMFNPADGRTDVFFYDNLKQEITPELEKMGPVETLKVFEVH